MATGHGRKITYEPWHESSNNLVCATSKSSDQPAHTRSLIRACASRLSRPFYYVKLLTEHHLKFLSLAGGCRGSSEYALVKIATLLEITCRGSFVFAPGKMLILQWQLALPVSKIGVSFVARKPVFWPTLLHSLAILSRTLHATRSFTT